MPPEPRGGFHQLKGASVLTETIPVWTTIAVAVIGSSGTATITAWLLRRLDRNDAQDNALRVLLFCQLEKINSHQVSAGHVCPTHVKERAEQIYSAYHALGGNGLGTQMIEDIRDAHIAPDDDGRKEH